MTFIKPSVDIIDEPDLYKRIEIAARTCYKSEDKTTDDSAKKMVKALIKRGHESPLEHSVITVIIHKREVMTELTSVITLYEFFKPVPHFVKMTTPSFVFSANVRAWRSLCRFNTTPLLTYICYCHFPELFEDLFIHSLTADLYDNYKDDVDVFINEGVDDRTNIVTARFTCDRGVSHELVRHRLLAISQTSTRYVNYKDGLTLIEPWWWTDQETSDTQLMRASCQAAEDAYRSLIASGSSPQKARAVLPNMLKTEVVATGTVEYWKKYVLPLRLSKAAHPDIRRVMEMFCQKMNWDPEEFR